LKQESDGHQQIHEREKQRSEHSIEGLQAQLDELQVAKKHADEQSNSLERQLVQEREGRFQALQKARASEEEAETATASSAGLQQELEACNRKLKDTGTFNGCVVWCGVTYCSLVLIFFSLY